MAKKTGIDNVPALGEAVKRLIALPVEKAKPEKLFMLWMVADYIYRDTVAPDDQFDMSTIMQADLADMEKRAYLQPLIK